MLYDLLYYIAVPTVISTASIATMYILYPEKVKQYLLNCSWRATEMMVDYNDFKDQVQNQVENITKSLLSQSDDNNSDSEETEHEIEDNYIFYDRKVKSTFMSRGNVLNNKESLKNNKNIKVIFLNRTINDNEYYKRIEQFENIDQISESELSTTEKQFIQVEYITESGNNEEIIDIHNYLGKFYIDGNLILDKYFLEWYLFSYYSTDIKDEYKLRIFDKDVNMFVINQNQGIIFSNDTYSKIDIENESEEDSDYTDSETSTETSTETSSETSSEAASSSEEEVYEGASEE